MSHGYATSARTPRARRRSSASTRITSCSSPTRRWTRSAAPTGTSCAAPATSRPPSASRTPAGRLLKKPEKLTDTQAVTLARLRAAGGEVWRAYELKEAARLSRVARSRLEPFVRLGKTIRKHRDGILAAIRLGITHRGPRRHPCRESPKSLLKRKRSRSSSGLVSISPRGTTAARGPAPRPSSGMATTAVSARAQHRLVLEIDRRNPFATRTRRAR